MPEVGSHGSMRRKQHVKPLSRVVSIDYIVYVATEQYAATVSKQRQDCMPTAQLSLRLFFSIVACIAYNRAPMAGYALRAKPLTCQ